MTPLSSFTVLAATSETFLSHLQVQEGLPSFFLRRLASVAVSPRAVCHEELPSSECLLSAEHFTRYLIKASGWTPLCAGQKRITCLAAYPPIGPLYSIYPALSLPWAPSGAYR